MRLFLDVENFNEKSDTEKRAGHLRDLASRVNLWEKPRVIKAFYFSIFLFFTQGEVYGHARFTPGYPLILRNPGDSLKNVDDPCGAPPTTSNEKRSVFRAGQELEILFEETVAVWGVSVY